MYTAADLRTIRIWTPDGRGFNVNLGERLALDLAAFCNVTKMPPYRVITLAFDKFFEDCPDEASQRAAIEQWRDERASKKGCR